MAFAWSYSALTNFETCPKKYHAYSIAKSVKEPENENMRWGFQVHEALAKRVAFGKTLPDTMTGYEKWARFALTNPSPSVIVKAEQKMAITVDRKPCDYFARTKTSPQPWLRSVLDVFKHNDKVGRIIDWKTGAIPRYADKLDEAKVQLSLGAVVAFLHHPTLQAIKCELVYLQEDSEQDVINRSEVVQRTDMDYIWRMATPRVMAMMDAEARQDYPPKPSGLCKKHCAVTGCEYHGKGAF